MANSFPRTQSSALCSHGSATVVCVSALLTANSVASTAVMSDWSRLPMLNCRDDRAREVPSVTPDSICCHELLFSSSFPPPPNQLVRFPCQCPTPKSLAMFPAVASQEEATPSTSPLTFPTSGGEKLRVMLTPADTELVTAADMFLSRRIVMLLLLGLSSCPGSSARVRLSSPASVQLDVTLNASLSGSNPSLLVILASDALLASSSFDAKSTCPLAFEPLPPLPCPAPSPSLTRP
mmetsp:Transcript_49952/g.156352  ORF Transcript_49952/g.156352 Transcript_49952/m.156352 type:complete len:236 (+) Transcript_49952:2254-2961(+)